jgi:hypothetical protein
MLVVKNIKRTIGVPVEGFKFYSYIIRLVGYKRFRRNLLICGRSRGEWDLERIYP